MVNPEIHNCTGMTMCSIFTVNYNRYRQQIPPNHTHNTSNYVKQVMQKELLSITVEAGADKGFEVGGAETGFWGVFRACRVKRSPNLQKFELACSYVTRMKYFIL